ncbi:hypothetical protein NL676_036116 [Syzygium grande]|nr:hypothetical protein NL676_036116 [Syzygium grande]
MMNEHDSTTSSAISRAQARTATAYARKSVKQSSLRTRNFPRAGGIQSTRENTSENTLPTCTGSPNKLQRTKNREWSLRLRLPPRPYFQATREKERLPRKCSSSSAPGEARGSRRHVLSLRPVSSRGERETERRRRGLGSSPSPSPSPPPPPPPSSSPPSEQKRSGVSRAVTPPPAARIRPSDGDGDGDNGDDDWRVRDGQSLDRRAPRACLFMRSRLLRICSLLACCSHPSWKRPA